MASISSMPSNLGPFNLFQDIGFFDPSIVHLDSKTRQFNEAADFLRNLQHCQSLYRYRKTNLLKFLPNCLNGPAFEWLKKRSHFGSLHTFNTALTTAFPSQLEARAQKLTKRKARKAAKRAELKTTEAAKPTPKLQDIGIFDPTLASDRSEFGLYREVACFLQHLQQCQHQYRKSDLLNLLPKCLCGLASEWFKTQSEFTSLKRFGRALAKAFPEASVRRAPRSSNLQLSTLDVISESIETPSDSETTSARVTCKLCKQSFNSNEELYEHIRNHEALKLATDSYLSVNAVNLVCETKETSSASHKSPAIQKPVNEFALASRTVTLLKRSYLSPSTPEARPESTERSTTCRHCDETFNSKESLREHKREQHRRKPIESSLLSFNTLNSMCEDEEKPAFDDSPASSELQAPIATPKQKSESAMTSEAIASLKDSHLPLSTLETEPESAERPATCRHCKQTFKFKELLRKHKREQHAKKPATSSPLRSHAPKPVCKAEEKSAVKDVTALPASHELRTPDQEVDVQKHSIVNSLLLIDTAKSTCKVAEKSATASIAKFSEPTSEERAESRTRTAYLSARLKASRLDLPLNTFVTILETVENASIQGAACARAMCRSCKQNFNSNKELFEHINEHETMKRINTAKAACESVKISTINSSSSASLTIQSEQISEPPTSSKSITSLKSSPLTSSTLKPLCEFKEKATSTCSPSSHESLTLATPRNSTPNTETPLQSVSSKCSSLQLRVPNSAPRPTESASIQRTACVRTACKRCKQNFNSNNKLHEHIRQHHARKSVKSSDLRVSAPDSTYKTVEKSAVSCSITSQFAPPTPSATPRSQISSAEMDSRPVSPKGSHLTIATHRIAPELTESASATCPLTPPPSPPWTPVRKHQESYTQKSYLTMNDLSRMFAGKPKPFGLPQHQNRPPSPQNPGICQPTPSAKPHLTIENLSEMFGGKARRNSLFQGQMNLSSREFSSGQSRITTYFKPTANQKPSISQSSKSSKPKSMDQHVSAESIRTASSRDPPEKSADLSYKLPDVSCTNSKPSAETSSFIFILLRLLPAFLIALAFVSALSAARMSCINAYGQAFSAIGRAVQ